MATTKKKRIAATTAFKRFHKDYDELVRWLIFIYELAEREDRSTKIASKALLPLETDERKIRDLKRRARIGSGAMKRYNKHRRLLREIFSVRLVDSYLCYIADLLTILHKNRIELLNLRSTISLAEVLTFKNFEDMHGHLIEKRVLDLSYKGIGELDGELSSKLNFPIFKDAVEKARLIKIVEIRNLLVHNRGKINRRFLDRTNNDALERIGKSVDLGNPMDTLFFVYAHAIRVDHDARKKFGVRPTAFIPANHMLMQPDETTQ